MSYSRTQDLPDGKAKFPLPPSLERFKVINEQHQLKWEFPNGRAGCVSQNVNVCILDKDMN